MRTVARQSVHTLASAGKTSHPSSYAVEPDALYALPLDAFVRERDAAARRLRAAGEPERGAEIAALRKPTVVAWVANQLARRHRRDVDLLLSAGHRLRAARDPETLAEARRAERDALADLRAAATEILLAERGKAGDAMLDRVTTTLRAAAVSDEGRELLALGRLVADVPPGGFELLAARPPSSAGTRRPKRSEAASRMREAVADARQRVREARASREDAKRGVRAAERTVAQSRKALEEAESALADSARELERADRELAEAERALAEARKSRPP
jgi:hypothetical protein